MAVSRPRRWPVARWVRRRRSRPQGPDYVALAADLTTRRRGPALWNQAKDAGHMTQGLSDHLQQRRDGARGRTDLGGGRWRPRPRPPRRPLPPPSPTPRASYEAQTVGPDADAVWQQIVAEAGKRGMTLPDLEDDVATFFGGMSSAEASGSELAEYLKDLQGRAEAGAA